MVRRALALALAVLALGACSQTQKNAYVHIGHPSLPRSSITAIAFSRLGCRGSCPIYTLTLSRGDTATYQGKYYVDKIGTYDGYIDFETIATWLDGQDVDDYAGIYGTLVADAERINLEVSRTDRTVVIYSGDTGSLPVQVQGIIAALDGFGEGVRWKPASALEPYLGYFLNDNTPGELFAIRMHPDTTSPGALGVSQVVYVGKCASEAFASDQHDLEMHLVGSHVNAQEKPYSDEVGHAGPKIPITLAREPSGLSVGIGAHKRSYHRVTWREYEAAYTALRTKFEAVCPTNHPE